MPGARAWPCGSLIAQALDAQVERLAWRRGELLMAVRIAVSGREATPSLFETLEGVGQAATIRRLEGAISRLPG